MATVPCVAPWRMDRPSVAGGIHRLEFLHNLDGKEEAPYAVWTVQVRRTRD
jgi:hypothetical protein